MNNFPDFSRQGYQVLCELGRNPLGGRVTYLAHNQTGQPVVIKQFQFAKGRTWDGFKAIEREMQTLKELDHPGIPRYLDTLETADGFCLVQEYKQGRMLSQLIGCDSPRRGVSTCSTPYFERFKRYNLGYSSIYYCWSGVIYRYFWRV